MRKLYSTYFDSVTQAQAVSSADSCDNRTFALFLGKLRKELLFNDTIVVPDSYLYDGRFFGELARRSIGDPQILHGLTGKLEIRARNISPAKSRIGFIRTGELAKPFEFSSLGDDHKAAVYQELLQRKESGAPCRWRSLGRALKDLGVDEVAVDRLQTAWSVWDRLAKEKAITLRVWNGTATVACDFAKAPPPSRIALGDWATIVSDVKALANNRSMTRDHFKKLSAAATLDQLLDIQRFGGWYETAYNRAIARQHGCNACQFHNIYLGDTEAFGTGAERAIGNTGSFKQETTMLEFPEWFYLGLGSMESSEFNSIVRATEPEFALWRLGNSDALKSALFDRGLMRRIEQSAPQHQNLMKPASILRNLEIAGFSVLIFTPFLLDLLEFQTMDKFDVQVTIAALDVALGLGSHELFKSRQQDYKEDKYEEILKSNVNFLTECAIDMRIVEDIPKKKPRR